MYMYIHIYIYIYIYIYEYIHVSVYCVFCLMVPRFCSGDREDGRADQALCHRGLFMGGEYNKTNDNDHDNNTTDNNNDKQ